MGPSKMIEAGLTQAQVRRVYNGIAWMYDLWGVNTEGRARQRGIALANVQDGERVLDVATGTGLILADIVKINRNGLNAGIDIAAGMLEKARNRLKKTRARAALEQASALAIPYSDGSFDLITNGYMFDLMPVDMMPKILAEFRRVLKPDGRLVLVNMTVGVHSRGQVYQRLYRHAPALLGGCRGVEMAGILQDEGYRVVAREYLQQFMVPSEVILARPA